MDKITVNGIEYEYEREGVFDEDYAFRIILNGRVIRQNIVNFCPDEKYIEYVIEQIQKTR